LKLKTIYNPHKPKAYLIRQCRADDLYLHYAGVACGNCGVIVMQDVLDEGKEK